MQRIRGRSHDEEGTRKGITAFELADMFPNEEAATRWFEELRWPGGDRYCGKCGSCSTHPVPNAKPMPYWCTDCASYFSVRTGSVLASSRLPLRKWAYGIYYYVTNLKGISSMRLHREIGVTQKTAWFMLHRLREAWKESGLERFTGPVEADEAYMGGLERNKHKTKRINAGGGTVGKSPVVVVKDRETNRIVAKAVPDTRHATLQVSLRTTPKPFNRRIRQGRGSHERS